MSNDLLASILYPNHDGKNVLHYAEERGIWPLWFIPSSALEGFLKSMIRNKKSHLKEARFDAHGNLKSADIEIEYPREGEFIKLYIDGYEKLKDIGGYTPIIAALCNNMSYAQDGSIIYTCKSMLEDVAEKCKVTLSQVRHTITKLVKHAIFFRIAPNKYQVNPYVIAKGWESDVIKLRDKFDGEFAGVILRDKKHDVHTIVLALPDGDTVTVKEDDLEAFMKQHNYTINKSAEFKRA